MVFVGLVVVVVGTTAKPGAATVLVVCAFSPSYQAGFGRERIQPHNSCIARIGTLAFVGSTPSCITCLIVLRTASGLNVSQLGRCSEETQPER
mmetsp:Transcript_30318/g.46543  ORF Transcript_30318/g.46543 Transcript_30318/m.46543 type:complete len:93 (+) Transcript_30318:1986-2264(+)